MENKLLTALRMDSDSDVDMSWVELAQDNAAESETKMPKRELSPATVSDTILVAKRPRLETESLSDAKGG